MFSQPIVRTLVENMIFIEESEEDVAVEEGTHQIPSSSINSCTCSSVMTWPVAEITGTPLRIPTCQANGGSGMLSEISKIHFAGRLGEAPLPL